MRAHVTMLHTLRDSFGTKHNSDICKEGFPRCFERLCGESTRFWKVITSGRAGLRLREGTTPSRRFDAVRSVMGSGRARYRVKFDRCDTWRPEKVAYERNEAESGI
ncbi:hypothetical protein PENSPDRAFT_407933 [Peniophora sp. CONT]|nr:hypothetical protein PENSPDRAFT_407933 [Peniophora sp. CONT]